MKKIRQKCKRKNNDEEKSGINDGVHTANWQLYLNV